MVVNYTHERRKTAGLCISCGLTPPSPGTNYCEPCRTSKGDDTKAKREKARSKGICVNCLSRKANKGKTLCELCRVKKNAKTKQIEQNKKRTVLEHYGGQCMCCGKRDFRILTIDHIDGKGAEHRRKISPSKTTNGGGGKVTYRWLIKNNFPPGFQTLCYDCQALKGTGLECPHQAEMKFSGMMLARIPFTF